MFKDLSIKSWFASVSLLLTANVLVSGQSAAPTLDGRNARHPALPAASAIRNNAVFSTQELKFAEQNPGVFQVQSVVIEEQGAKELPADQRPKFLPPFNDSGTDVEQMIDIGQIINVASTVWKIIEENAPLINISKDYANALPKGIQQAAQLSGWHPPEGTVYSFRTVNMLGMTVVDVKYQVVRSFGGSYVRSDGVARGKYLTGVTIEPLSVRVAWGYRLNMAVAAPSVINAGSKDDPVAGITINLQWQISTPLKKEQGVGIYYVQGDGLFKEVGGPFTKVSSAAMRQKLDRARVLAVAESAGENFSR